MDRLEAMRVLLTAVETGSLSAAGRELGIPLPSVSRKVSALEAQIKTRLLQRSTRSLALTDAGRAYVEACKRILSDVDEAERAAAGEYSAPQGDLVITAPIVFGRLHVLPVVTEFLKAYPDVDVHLIFGDSVVNLLEDQADLAVRIGELPDSSLVATRIGHIRFVVCGSPRYLAERGRPTRIEELASHDCITFEGLASADGWRFVSGNDDVTVPIRSRLIVSTADAAIAAAVGGAGLTRVLCYQVADAVQAGELEIVLADVEPRPWPVSLVYAGRGRLPLKLRAFLDFARERLRARVAASALATAKNPQGPDRPPANSV